MDAPESVCGRFRTKAMVHGGTTLVRTRKTLEFPYCWCTRTLTDLGPDGFLVDLAKCSDAGRPCFESVVMADRLR
ncbi:MAG TPA: hypothetical protein VJ960_04520 [Oceanipulchritudo sp.]|nr:hypothetical protein [Oceanipulchritudo sp.]